MPDNRTNRDNQSSWMDEYKNNGTPVTSLPGNVPNAGVTTLPGNVPNMGVSTMPARVPETNVSTMPAQVPDVTDNAESDADEIIEIITFKLKVIKDEIITLNNVPAGTYHLKPMTSPDGETPLTDEYTVDVDEAGNGTIQLRKPAVV